MRILTPLILLPLVVLAPLLMVPIARADGTVVTWNVYVGAQQGDLLEAQSPEEIEVSLTLFARGTQDMLSGQSGQFYNFFGFEETPSASGHLESEGFLHGKIALFTGAVTRSTDPDLLRTPVAIRANATDGVIVFVFGPIPAGRLAGQTFTFKGVGIVLLVCLDCRSD